MQSRYNTILLYSLQNCNNYKFGVMSIKAHKYLVEKGVKPSLQRLAVMGYLMTHHTHPTVDEIFSALVGQMPTLSRTTVYNTLNALVGCGAVLQLDIDARTKRYDGDTSLHAHFMCDGCGAIEDIRILQHDFVSQNAPQGAQIRDVQLLYKGKCKKCNIKN